MYSLTIFIAITIDTERERRGRLTSSVHVGIRIPDDA